MLKIQTGEIKYKYLFEVTFNAKSIHSYSYFQISENLIKPPLIWLLYLTWYANFQITLCLMKSNGCVSLLNILPKNLKYEPISMSMSLGE